MDEAVKGSEKGKLLLPEISSALKPIVCIRSRMLSMMPCRVDVERCMYRDTQVRLDMMCNELRNAEAFAATAFLSCEKGEFVSNKVMLRWRGSTY